MTREKIEAIDNLLHDQSPSRRRSARARDVLSMAGKLWNLTYVVRAGRYFEWRLLRLTGLHDERHPRNQNVVPLGSGPSARNFSNQEKQFLPPVTQR